MSIPEQHEHVSGPEGLPGGCAGQVPGHATGFPPDASVPAAGVAHGPAESGFPCNELEEALAASVGVPGAGPRLIEVLGRSHVWVPLPNGGGPDSRDLDLPTTDVGGMACVPVFSSEDQFLRIAGSHMSFTVAPAREFARGLPPQLGIAVNPEGTVGLPLPPEAVAELCRTGRSELDGPASGGRVRLFEPDWQDDPVDFLTAAAEEFAGTGLVIGARRCLASVEGDEPALFVGVELARTEPEDRTAVLDALGRALGRAGVRWPVQLVFLDVAAHDPVGDWMLGKLRPFHTAGR
ncbi:enhanced serine sensitivity protein SseB [Streptomyces meridianus]|uniref:Enhanced serine sensitivity protein SseB n=1 Tax=Streptomyces meridianus TaxID=2938945 RepID=A0ABT0X2J3_9ACTN|nr:enhanced serine sensitivity protein SseB [Streptomyces meridianus]MCM2576761.1 enhanced serine sensitivity protein SseB [Streptomyces meridianus]